MHEDMNKMYLVCEHCGEAKPDVEASVNPYILEIGGYEIIQNICNECLYELHMDI